MQTKIYNYILSAIDWVLKYIMCIKKDNLDTIYNIQYTIYIQYI